jgi:hypothetical protein
MLEQDDSDEVDQDHKLAFPAKAQQLHAKQELQDDYEEEMEAENNDQDYDYEF